MGGIPELISNGEDGLLVPPNSPVALRDAIKYFAKNPQRAVEMGQSGRAKVEQKFDKDCYYESVLDVYRKAQQRLIS
jgi:glycosyltransferase involved in cell wall biosynthesis